MATKQRLIDANAVRHTIEYHLVDVIYRGSSHIPSGKEYASAFEFLRGYEEGAKYIANLVLQEKYLVDAVEVVHGYWIDVALRFTQVKEKCSVCGGIVYAHGFNYCPNCGAKMDGDSK